MEQRWSRLISEDRNVSQMAEFEGQHECVSAVNNYYAESDLDHFTQIQGQETEPKLPDAVKPGLLKLLNMANMHPVKVSLHYKLNPMMLTESYKVCKVLDMICESAMKARDTDDVMAMKAHYFATVLRKAKDEQDINTWIKKLLAGRAEDGYPELQDQLIRQSLREFPYRESIMLLNMVTQLHNTKIGDSPTALHILMLAVNGQNFDFAEGDKCTSCNEPYAKRCTKCKMAYYCNRECQLLHWPTHKKFCAKLAGSGSTFIKMEETSSKSEVVSKRNKGKVLGQPSLPVQPPYNDTPVEYCSIFTSEVLDMHYISHNQYEEPKESRYSIIMDSYYPRLTDMYQQGYKLLVFIFHYIAKEQKHITAKFEGIFRKMFPEEAGQIGKLGVEKSMLKDRMFKSWDANVLLNASSHSEFVKNGHHLIFQKITNLAQKGGRLVSVEMTGMGAQEIREHMQLMQIDPVYWAMYKYGEIPPMQIEVDVFYEMPLRPTTERYTYQVVTCLMNSSFQQSLPRGHFVSVIDWQGVMKQYMGSGWKLVEILEDYSVATMTKQQAFAITQDIRKNCLWIFEKPLSRLNDNTAYYEGTMVECQLETTTHVDTMRFRSTEENVLETNWMPILTDMGKYGWQVVRILETPDMDVTGTYYQFISTRQMIFFQRTLAGRNEFTCTSAS